MGLMSAPKPIAPRRIKLGQREIFTEGLAREVWHDLFHHFMTISWPRLFATLASSCRAASPT
jgi:hypothetical protein